MSTFQLDQWLRDNILHLKAYSSARDEYSGDALVYLDANENPFNNGLNRYPDPGQKLVKAKIASLFGLKPTQIFLGNGSDEAIDLLIRASCEARRDRIIAISPSYGMYQVCADIQDVGVDQVLLNEDFSLSARRILNALTDAHKLIFLCSPNNPTGNVLDEKDIRQLLSNFQGVVVIDEAYMDFSDQKSSLALLEEFSNLVVLRTFSKAWGMAGIRFGMAIGHPDIISALSKIKYPYNLNQLTQDMVLRILDNKTNTDQQVQMIQEERQKLSDALLTLRGIRKVYPSEANFVLIKVAHPEKVYHYLLQQGIVVRDRSKQDLCAGCLRITVGTPEENRQLLIDLKNIVS